MPDKEKIKKKLEEERDVLVSELGDIGKLNSETGEWEATPEELTEPQTDHNEMADRFGDFEARSSMVETLESRLKKVLNSLRKINRPSFGKCRVCQKTIEAKRLKANPAARTCKNHLDS